MKRFSYITVIAIVLAGSAILFGQEPTPAPVIPRPVADEKGVKPEDAAGVPQVAPNFRSDERTLPELSRIGIDVARQRTLTLQDAIEIALDNNLDIEVSRKTRRIADFDLRATDGIFQPRLNGQMYYDRSTIPNVSIFTNNQDTTTGTLLGNANVQAFAPNFGTVFTGSFNNQRLTTDNPISILSPQLNASMGFSVLQPLFRGRRYDSGRRTIEIAKKNLELTDTQFQLRSMEVVANVQKAYWDLTFALRNLQVQQDGVRDAKSQLEHNRRLVAEGQLAPIDIIAAETQVANFEQAVYEALNTVNLAENALKNLLTVNRNDVLWNEAVTPVEPVEIGIPDTTLADAVEEGIKNRPELEINRAQKDINQYDQKFYREQSRPQIDLTANYTSAGIGGTSNPNFSPAFPTPCATDPTSPACAAQQANLALLTGNPYRGVFENRYPVFRIGVNFSLPLFGDKTAKAQLGKSMVESDRLDVQREQIEQGIQIEVRNAIQAIRTAEARLRSAAIARENTARQYESEQRKLNEGQSDTYKVLERQTALTFARSSELRARIELNKAIAELQRATGRSLKDNNIEALPR